MITYRGIRVNDGVGHQPVYKFLDDGTKTELSPIPSQKLCNHSPDGFNWGYSGSGPAQLALALLLDVIGHSYYSYMTSVSRYYQSFKSSFVAGWGDSWEITDKEIIDWWCWKP